MTGVYFIRLNIATPIGQMLLDYHPREALRPGLGVDGQAAIKKRHDK
jgi:hypothetical protein